MSNDIETLLLKIGNATVKALKEDQTIQNATPQGAWQVSYMAEKSSLIFNILLQHDKFNPLTAAFPPEPPYWITLVAIFSVRLEYFLDVPENIRFVYIVNDRQGGKDWEASCTVKELLEIYYEAEGKHMHEALPIVMSTMELDRR